MLLRNKTWALGNWKVNHRNHRPQRCGRIFSKKRINSTKIIKNKSLHSCLDAAWMTDKQGDNFLIMFYFSSYWPGLWPIKVMTNSVFGNSFRKHDIRKMTLVVLIEYVLIKEVKLAKTNCAVDRRWPFVHIGPYSKASSSLIFSLKISAIWSKSLFG